MYRILLLSLLFIAFQSNSQTIPSSHLPRVGDTFVFNLDSSMFAPPILTGGVYDFSFLKSIDSTKFVYSTNNSTLDYPTCNIRMQTDTILTSSIYFKSTDKDLFVLGIAALTSQIPLPITQDLKGTLNYLPLPFTTTTDVTTTDAIKMVIPKSMIPPEFNIDSILGALVGAGSGATFVLDSVSVTLNVKMQVKCEGSGKIKTPVDNNLDVLKMSRKMNVDPVIFIHGLAKIGPISQKINMDVTSLLLGQLPVAIPSIIQHAYYSPSYRQEIVNATVDTNGKYTATNYRKRTKYLYNASNNQQGINQIDLTQSANNISILNLPQGQFEVNIFSIVGRNIKTQIVSSANNLITFKDNMKGIVLLQIQGNGVNLSRKIILE